MEYHSVVWYSSTYPHPHVGRDSLVSIVMCNWLDSLGIESRWGRDFLHLSRPVLWPTQPPMQYIPGLFRGVKRPGHGVDRPPSSSADAKERVELYIYSPPLWAFVACSRENFSFYLYQYSHRH